MAFLTVENLTHVYGSSDKASRAAINNISFSLERGKILGIIGHTGSGKSTLVSHLNGLIKPTSGRVLIDGEDIWANPKEIKKIRSKVGLVFQYPEYQLFEETVYDDISFGPKNLGIINEKLDCVVRSAASLMKVEDELLSKSPFDLSGGQKRRVAIAGVLAMEPEIVVFDEPTAGLDPVGRETIFKAISDYQHQKNATVIIVSHSMEDIASICDKVLVLSKGKVAMFDDTDKIFARSDELRSLGLGVPMITEVFSMVKNEIPDLLDYPLTVDAGVKAILKYLESGVRTHD